MIKEIKLSITGLVYNQTIVGTYGLVLSEEGGNRRFSVMIGEPEAQSIALKLNQKKSPRPLTHDLIQNMLSAFEANISKVLIYKMVNDVFYSELHINFHKNDIVIDARTSDAVALAVRSGAPIFINADILEIVGTEIETSHVIQDSEEVNVNAENLTNEEFDQLALSDLEELLNMAIQEEKYELAVKIRDAIKRKKK